MIKANKITKVPPLILLLCSLVALVPEISAAQDGQPQGSNTAQHVARKTEQQNDIYFSDSGRERTPAITAFPKYPSIARRDRIEGEATVCFTVNAKGQVIRPGIRSSSQRIFERPAMDAIRASTFEPLKPGEEKSNLKTCRVYRFKLAPIESAEPAEESNKET
jgi:TonB family protein